MWYRLHYCMAAFVMSCLHCRLLRLKLTDGKLSCIAAEFKPVPQLSEDLPPGTKICLTNTSVKLGVLLLDAKCVQASTQINTSAIRMWFLQSCARHRALAHS